MAGGDGAKRYAGHKVCGCADRISERLLHAAARVHIPKGVSRLRPLNQTSTLAAGEMGALLPYRSFAMRMLHCGDRGFSTPSPDWSVRKRSHLLPVSGGDDKHPIRSPTEREFEHRNVI